MSIDDLFNASNEIMASLETGVIIYYGAITEDLVPKLKRAVDYPIRGAKYLKHIFWEHVAKRPFLGWVLPKERQIKKSLSYGLKPNTLCWYSLVEFFISAPLFAGSYYLTGVDMSSESYEWVAKALNISKDYPIYFMMSVKGVSMCDSILRFLELTVWPKRPRASIIGGGLYYSFIVAPTKAKNFIVENVEKYAPKITPYVSNAFDWAQKKFSKKVDKYDAK